MRRPENARVRTAPQALLPPTNSATDIVEMSQMILPSDTNALGGAFGGRIMAWIDICAAIAAQRYARNLAVTASMDELHFHAPVRLGWIIQLRAQVLAAFRTSMEIGVTVYSEDPLTGHRRLTTTALLTFVALDASGQRAPVPPLQPRTTLGRRVAADAQRRRNSRLSRRGQDVRNAWVKLLNNGGG